MLCFEIYINGKKICTAGPPEHGSFSTTVSWHNRMQAEGEVVNDSHNGEIYATGYEDHDPWQGKHLKWFAECANWTLGDEIVIKVVESDSPDPAEPWVVGFTPEQEKQAREFRRRNYEKLKHEFESD